MKKVRNLIFLGIIMLFVYTMPVFAREMSVDELGSEALKKEPKTNYIYVIGEYAFTSAHTLTTQDVMVAAKSIQTTDKDGKTNIDDIYKKMAIQKITPKNEIKDGQIVVTGWKKDGDILGGDTTLDDTLNIKYIDYEFYPEKSKTKINLDVDDAKYSKYNGILKEKLHFQTKDFYGINSAGGRKLTLGEGNKISGLLLKNNSVSLNKEHQNKYKDANYFFAYILEVPEANEKTTIKVKTIKNEEVTSVWGDFDVQDKDGGNTPGIVLLAPISKTAWEINKTMTIVVDVDGDGEAGKEYEPTEYTLDLSGLTFQYDSEAELKSGSISKNDKVILDDWGYDPEINKELSLVDGKLKGKLIEQKLRSDVAFGKDKKDGYYFDFTFVLPDELDISKVKISQVKKDNSEIIKTFVEKEYDENGNLTILFRFDPKTEKCSGENCKIYYSVDYDGNGEDYLTKIYTIDYEDVIFEKSSMVKISSVKSSEIKGDSWKNWTHDEKYNVTFKEDGSVFKTTGLITMFDDEKWESKTNPFENGAEDYYLAIKLTKADKEESESDVVKFLTAGSGHGDVYEVTSKDFKENNSIYVLKYLNPNKDYDNKTFTITVDFDDGETYAPYTLTIDWSELDFQYDSMYTDLKIANSDDILSNDKSQLESWGYDFDKASGLKVETGDVTNPYNLTGIVKEQKEVKAGFKTNDGYYVALKIYGPDETQALNNHFLSQEGNLNKWTVKLKDEDGNYKAEYTPSEEEYKAGYVTALIKLKEKDDKHILSFMIDWDGSENDYFLPYEENINYGSIEYNSYNTVTYKYRDNLGEIHTVPTFVDEGVEVVAKDISSENSDYRKFDKWTNIEDIENQDVFAKEGGLKTSHDQDITLEAHWTINSDSFIKYVIDDLNSKNTQYSDDFTGEFNLSKSENKITINLDEANLPLTKLAETSIPGTIAYVLGKEEINEITLSVGNNTVTFNKDYTNNEEKDEYNNTFDRDNDLLGEEGTALKKEIIEGMKETFDKTLSGMEDKSTLDQLEYENKTFEIKFTSIDKTVKLIDSEENDITNDDTKKTYNFSFDSNFVVVNADSESKLGPKDIVTALNDGRNYNTIYIDGDITTNTINFNRDVIIEPVKDSTSTITANSDQDYVFFVKPNANVSISNFTLKGAKIAELKVGETPEVVGTTVTNSNSATATISNIIISKDDTKLEEGILVESASTLIVKGNLTYEAEKHDIPSIKGSKYAILNGPYLYAKVDIANANTSITKLNSTAMNIVKHDTKWCTDEGHEKDDLDGCEKTSFSDEYKVVNDNVYYINKDNSTEYCYIMFMDGRNTPLAKVVEKGKPINIPEAFLKEYKPLGTSDGSKFIGWKSAVTGKIVNDWKDETATTESQWYHAIYDK